MAKVAKSKNQSASKTFDLRITSLALDILRQEDNKKALSTVLSPFSISTALATVYAGADGKTKDEIGQLIAGTLTEDDLLEALCLKASKADPLIVTTCLAAREAILKPYQDRITQKLNVEVFKMSDDDEAAAKKINDHISKKTNGKIPKAVEAKYLAKDKEGYEAKAIIVNAVYFKAAWKTRLSNVGKQKFYESPTRTSKKTMIACSGPFQKWPFSESKRFEVVALPYQNKSSKAEYRFAVFLPKERCALLDICDSVTAEELQDLVNKLKSTDLKVAIPKFKLAKQRHMIPTLTKLGVRAVFSDCAQLPKICETSLKVSEVLHTATIDVNEIGTETTAVTMCRAQLAVCANRQQRTFIANHPFLYAILRGNTPLFVGQFLK